jgi:hypothetical protein
MRTSFHHQSEAQHPKSSAIHKYAGRLPHLWGQSPTLAGHAPMSEKGPEPDIDPRGVDVAEVP